MSENKRLSERNAKIAAMLSDGEQLKNFYRFIAQNPYINLHDACQIVIERPDATVCNSMEEWNALGRRVTKGRKAISYYDHDGYKQFVFDAADTHGEERYQRPIFPLKRMLIGLDELNGTALYPELIPIDDEPTPFDDEEEEQSNEEADDGFEDEEDFKEESEQEETENKPKPTRKKEEKGIKDRPRKQKPQLSLFDLMEPQEKSEQELLIERNLKYGSGFQHGKYRIFDKYNENPTAKAFADFLKREYGIGGRGGWGGDNEEHNGKGIRLSYCDENGKTLVEAFLKWPEVATRIADLIDDDNYLTEQEKAGYIEYRAEQNRQKELRAEEERQKREIIELAIVSEQPARKQRILDEYSKTTKIEDFAKFLRDEYGTAVEATSKYHARYDANGVYFSKYNAIGNTELRFSLSWNSFAEHVCDVIEAERLFAPEDAEYNAGFVDQMIELGTQNTESGKYAYHFATFGKDEGYVRAHCDEIKETMLKVHDYFLAKSVDKVKPGGIVAIVTSKGTMDKLNANARKYVAERAELLGAIRLPNTAFKQTAGTEAVADILFFRKREEKITDLSAETWLATGKTEEGYEINQYFIDHPEMVLGTLKEEQGLYGGIDTTVKPDGRDLKDALAEAIQNLPQSFYQNPDTSPAEEQTTEVDYNVKPLCYKAENGRLYMRIGDEMVEQAIPKSPKDAYQRIQGMIGLREELHHILDIQIQGCSDEVLQKEQSKLNAQYDLFVRRYGNLNSQTNTKLFKDDGDSALLFSCEDVDEETKAVTKSDVFSKRTIRPYVVPTSTDDPFEALQISKNERGKVDMRVEF